METDGHAFRTRSTIRATSSTAPGRPVDVRGPQPRAEHMRSTEDIQRQIAVVPVVPVEEPPFLLTVQRVVRRIDIQHDARRRRRVRLDEHVHQQGVEGRFVIGHFLVTVSLGLLRPDQFQPVQRALSRQRGPAVCLPHPVLARRVRLAHGRRHQRVAPQGVMVVQIFVAQRDGHHTLCHQILDRVFDQTRVPVVLEALRRAPAHVAAPFDCPEQQCPCVGSDRSAIKTGDQSAATDLRKLKLG